MLEEGGSGQWPPSSHIQHRFSQVKVTLVHVHQQRLRKPAAGDLNDLIQRSKL